MGVDEKPRPQDAEAYGRALRQLLPPGRALSKEPGSVMAKLLTGIGEELARIDQRVSDALEEMDPRTATETLAEWEATLGLEATATTEARRAAAAAKATATGGQSRAYMIGLAARFGFSATITESYPWVLRAGFPAGARCYGLAWVHNWVLVVDLGASQHGVGEWSEAMEAAINAVKPAHTTVGFEYL